MFNGARDSYQAPLALAEGGRLEALVTDWYAPLDRAWARVAEHFVPPSLREGVRRRHAEGLPSSLVVGGARGAFEAWRSRSDLSRLDAWLGTRAGRLAGRRGAGVFAYSYYAHAAFAAAPPDTARLIFQVHPHPRSLAALYDEELRLVPEARASLLAEEEAQTETPRFARLAEEPHLADGCIAASSFTRRTLIEQGIAPERVRVVPYGVDLERLTPAAPPPRRPFRVLFVGQMVQRKGLGYLLEAWRRLALPDAELVLAGRGTCDRPLLARFDGLAVRREAVSERELLALYRSAHVFCMPSIAEGFGLVYLEALACGTPAIGTPNTGAPDVVRHGREGFIVGVRDVDALAARLRWCYDHPEALEQMRSAARARAEEFSWPAFRRELRAAVDVLGAPAESRERDVPALAWTASGER